MSLNTANMIKYEGIIMGFVKVGFVKSKKKAVAGSWQGGVRPWSTIKGFTSQALAIGVVGIASIIAAQVHAGALAENLTIVPSIAYQDKTLSFDQQYTGLAENDADFSVSMPVLTLSLSAVYNKFFVSVKTESTRADAFTGTTETDRSTLVPAESNLIALEGSGVNVGREDLSFTVGYKISDRIGVFVGYLEGETKLTPSAICANPLDFCTRTNRAFQQFFAGERAGDPNQETYVQRYTENGPFVGASYNLPVSDHGTLSTSAAYASMDGEYRDNASDPDGFFGGTFRKFNYTGETTGLSLSLTWTAPLGNYSAYFIDLRRQAYSMNGEDPDLQGVFLQTDETMVGISAGVQFYY